MGKFERPQYLTAQGLRRRTKNPSKNKNTQTGREIIPGVYIDKHKKGLSKEAAKVIAMAIRGMLKG